MNANTAKTVTVDFVVKPLAAYMAVNALAFTVRRVSNRKANKKFRNEK